MSKTSLKIILQQVGTVEVEGSRGTEIKKLTTCR